MHNIVKYCKVIIAGTSVCGGAALIHYAFCDDEKFKVNESTSIKWDWNWDRRDPISISEEVIPESENATKTKSMRNIILIRHGEYNLSGKTDAERCLTKTGQKQAEYTGERLKMLNYPYTMLVASTMTRANETASIIQRSLKNLNVESCSLLYEGTPATPEPSLNRWYTEIHQSPQDAERIEAAFKKYFYRASPSQKVDSYDIIVCHANVIRYLVCRALQFPPEAWLRLSLYHCGITWLAIHPSGRVTLRMFGDSGHIPCDVLTL